MRLEVRLEARLARLKGWLEVKVVGLEVRLVRRLVRRRRGREAGGEGR